jgi:hypothetical protein
MTSPDDERRLAEQRLDEVRKQTTEYMAPASEADFIEIARRTDATVSFNHGQPSIVQWQWHKNTLHWIIPDRGEDRKLLISIEGSENNDINSAGIVMGLSYVAFVEKDPDNEGGLKGYIATRDSVRAFSDPANMFVPLFEQAANIASAQSDLGK